VTRSKEASKHAQVHILTLFAPRPKIIKRKANIKETKGRNGEGQERREPCGPLN
jgi:hypothetical protein